MSEQMKGTCLCGKVNIVAQLAEPKVNACHCDMCRQWSAGPFMAVVASEVKFEGDEFVSVYQSSDWAERMFCNNCGTSLAYRMKDHSFQGVSANLFDGAEKLAMGMQFFIDQKPETYSFEQDTQKLTAEECMAMFE